MIVACLTRMDAVNMALHRANSRCEFCSGSIISDRTVTTDKAGCDRQEWDDRKRSAQWHDIQAMFSKRFRTDLSQICFNGINNNPFAVLSGGIILGSKCIQIVVALQMPNYFSSESSLFSLSSSDVSSSSTRTWTTC